MSLFASKHDFIVLSQNKYDIDLFSILCNFFGFLNLPTFMITPTFHNMTCFVIDIKKNICFYDIFLLKHL